MLAEWMLARMVSWSKVHKEAHNMEHAISTEVEEALFAALNSPEFCPHGNPLPGNEDMATDWLPLTGAPLNTQLVIRRIHEFAEDSDLVMDFLEEHHISPGQQVWIREILAFNQTLDLCVENQVVSLGFPLARYIFAEPSSTPLAR
jgi:DtxR family Mn-dependent transcriptional regulator